VTNLQPYVKKNEESFKQKKENLLEEEVKLKPTFKKNLVCVQLMTGV